MKRIIAFLLALTLCCGLMAACAPADNTDGTAAGATIEDAAEYLVSCYRGDEGKKTAASYSLMGQLLLKGTKFEVTWTVDNAAITLEAADGKCNVKLPSKNDTEVTYTLTATIKDAAGKTVSKTFKRVLPVYDDGAAVTEPVEGEAYKLFFEQANLGKTLYCITETQDDKYIKTDVDPKKGADFYAEKVEGGYKFYTTIDGVKNYLHASTVEKEDGKISKHLSFATESDSVYYYKSELKTWFVTINNLEYGVGTYSSYNTLCISESSHFKAEAIGVTQFCMTLIGKADAEALDITEGPADPTELSTITELVEKANALEDGAQTAEKYLVKGTITEIANDTYGNLYIEDEAGNKLYVYGVYNKDGSTRFDAMNPQPKVGDTVTLMGVLSNYKGDGQMKNGWVQELVSAGGNETEEPVTPTEEYASTPVVGKTYKLGLYQEVKGEVNYFIGEMKGYYGATTTNKANGVDVTVEDAGDGKYCLSFTVGGAKKYVGTEVNGKHLNFIIVDEANRASFTWNAEYKTFVTVMSNGTEAFMGTYGDYFTIGMSALDKISTSYPVHLYN